jgi:hypothetical protein
VGLETLCNSRFPLEGAKKMTYIVYCDCGDMFSPNIKSYVENTLSNDDVLSSSWLGNNQNGQTIQKKTALF